jgi:phage terminase small subunit
MTDANATEPTESAPADDLSSRQRAFCAEYLVDRNGTQAAIRAGYSAASAKQQASRLLAHPKIKANITAALEQLALDAGVKAEDVVAKLKQIAWSTPSETWRSSDILKALELLGKHLKMWAPDVTAKLEVTDPGGDARERLGNLIMARLAALRPPATIAAATPAAGEQKTDAMEADAAAVEQPSATASPSTSAELVPSLDAVAAPGAPVPASRAVVVHMKAPDDGSSEFWLNGVKLTPDANRCVYVPVEQVALAKYLGFRPVAPTAQIPGLLAFAEIDRSRAQAASASREAIADEARRSRDSEAMLAVPPK